jgi:hypothetical protein
MDFENGRSKVVGIGGTLREGSTSLAAHTKDAMVHVVHALRGVVGPLTVAVPKVWKISDGEGLGLLVVELAEKVSPAHGIPRVETVRIAV